MPPLKDPVVSPQMLIRRPVAEGFEAFVDPRITTKFWFTKGSGRVETGGFSLLLAGAKAYLEHGVELHLVADRHPGATAR